MKLSGLEESIFAMRMPKMTHSQSDSDGDRLGPKDLKLASNLIKAGTDHAKFSRGIIAYLYLEMQVGWMIEFETYRHGVETLSTSSAMYMDLGGMKGSELAEYKQSSLPDKVYHRVVTVSYQALRSMYKARRNHRHPDWQIFCDFVETLPYFKELIAPE